MAPLVTPICAFGHFFWASEYSGHGNSIVFKPSENGRPSETMTLTQVYCGDHGLRHTALKF